MKLSSNVVGNSNDVNNFIYNLSLNNRQASNLRKAFVNGLLANTKLSKTQLDKIRQPRGFLCRLSGSSLITELPLLGNVLKPLNKSVLMPLGLTSWASVRDAAIHNKRSGSSNTTLIISN